MKKNFYAFFIGFLFLMPSYIFCQATDYPSYNLDCLIGKYVSTTNPAEIILIFKYEPKEGKVFKPIFSMKIAYSLGSEQKEITEVLETSNHAIEFFDRTIKKKSKYFYSLIKDKINLKQKTDFGILVFRLRNLTKDYIEKMTFTYGLWEPENNKVRIEKKFDISIDK